MAPPPIIPDYDEIRDFEKLANGFHGNFIACIKEKYLSEISIENKEIFIDEMCKTLGETAQQVASKAKKRQMLL